MLMIGIDPGKNTGIAICESGKIAKLYTSDFWGAIEAIDTHPDAFIVIELPDTKHVWHNKAKTKGAIQRTGVNVGSVIREAQLLRDYLVRNGREHITQKPTGIGKNMNADKFKRLTGWSGRTNEHMRDAAILCVGIKKPLIKPNLPSIEHQDA